MSAKRFTATLFQDDQTPACGVELPFNPKEAFGRVRAPVRVTIGKYVFRTTTCSMGGKFWIGFNRAHREGAGIAAGDRITVVIEPDTQPRVIVPPPDFAAALRADPAAEAAWKKLSYTHQKEHVAAIEQAKKPETRQRRIAKALAALQ